MVHFAVVVLIVVGLLLVVAVFAGTAKQASRPSHPPRRFYEKMPPSERYAFFAELFGKLSKGTTLSEIEKWVPNLSKNIEIARAVSKAYWTDSVDFDELAKAEIVPPNILKALDIPFAMSGSVIHVPAGVMHTYGYVFSQLQTSFGLKGKRWIGSRIDERLGLPAGSFSPFASKGEFLSNLTFALWKLIPGISISHPLIPIVKVSPAVKRLAPEIGPMLFKGQVIEEVSWKTNNGEKKGRVLTSLLELRPLKGFSSTDVMLLVYGLEIDGVHRFTTAFPIDQKFADSFISAKSSAPGQPPSFKPRFNLYIDPSWRVTAYSSQGFKMAKP